MNKDYNSFTKNNSDSPSPELSTFLKSKIAKELQPDTKIVLLKLLAIQGIIGTLTMLFCPQFNLSLTNNHELFHYFHRNYGDIVCMLICGSIFMGTSAFFSSYILNFAEIKRIKESRILFNIATTGILVSILLILGADIYIKLFFFWLIGALISSISLFEINTYIKQKVFLLK